MPKKTKLKVGLTGGIGSGKSYIAGFFEKLGIPIYFADKEAKLLMIKNKSLKADIKQLLGFDSYHQNGRPNRPIIASKVFNDKKLLKKLNALVHPAVQNDYAQWSDIQKAPYTIEESAILFEIGADNKFDKTVLVTADKETRIKRVLKRDKTPRKAIESRMKNQLSDEKKIPLADFIIVNDGTSDMAELVLEIHNKILKNT